MEQPIANSSEAIFYTLRDEILDLQLKPGQALSENSLCLRFGVSRTPIRTVLRRLEGCGLVNIIPYKGTYVSLLDFNEIYQTIYMRIAVESMVLRDFIKVVTPLILEKLRYVIRKQRVLLDETFKSSQFFILDSQLHEIWFAVMDKKLLWEKIQQSQVQYTRFRMLDITAMQEYPTIISEHEDLFELIEHKRGDDIEELMSKHLTGGISRLTERINTDLADYFITTAMRPKD